MTTSITPMALGARIKERRIELQLTQQELARKAGIAQSTLSALEKGKAEKSRDLVSIAQALKTNAFYLSTGKGDKDAIQTSDNLTPIPVAGTLIFMSDICRDKFVNDPRIKEINLDLYSTDPTIYALLIRGSGLSPYIKDQEKIVVSSLQPAIQGSLVFVQFTDGSCTARTLVSQDQSFVTLKNFEAKDSTYAVSSIKSIEKITMIVQP